MTVFPDGTAERLHGHNYHIGVALDLADASFERMVPFQAIKDAVHAVCAAWKEHLLIAGENPHVEVVRDEVGEIELSVCGKRYVAPRQDVLILPVDNTSTEALAAHVADLLLERLAGLLARAPVTAMQVTVTESPGQGASVRREISGNKSRG